MATARDDFPGIPVHGRQSGAAQRSENPAPPRSGRENGRVLELAIAKAAMSSPDSRLLFVYGSLKRTYENHAVLGSATFQGVVRTDARYGLGRLGAYPVLLDAGNSRISGELYIVSATELARLDAFEGRAYERREVVLEGDRRAEAYFATPRAAARAVPLDATEWELIPKGRAARTPGTSAETS